MKEKKLVLNKKTITNLNEKELKLVKGGDIYTKKLCVNTNEILTRIFCAP